MDERSTSDRCKRRGRNVNASALHCCATGRMHAIGIGREGVPLVGARRTNAVGPCFGMQSREIRPRVQKEMRLIMIRVAFQKLNVELVLK